MKIEEFTQTLREYCRICDTNYVASKMGKQWEVQCNCACSPGHSIQAAMNNCEDAAYQAREAREHEYHVYGDDKDRS